MKKETKIKLMTYGSYAVLGLLSAGLGVLSSKRGKRIEELEKELAVSEALLSDANLKLAKSNRRAEGIAYCLGKTAAKVRELQK